jgi:hypothetical protein
MPVRAVERTGLQTVQPAGSPRGSAAARPVDGSKLLGQFLTERGRHGGVGWFLDALSFTALTSRSEAEFAK